jgi:hypothetical protein
MFTPLPKMARRKKRTETDAHPSFFPPSDVRMAQARDAPTPTIATAKYKPARNIRLPPDGSLRRTIGYLIGNDSAGTLKKLTRNGPRDVLRF